jgi:hypothetical protein
MRSGPPPASRLQAFTYGPVTLVQGFAVRALPGIWRLSRTLVDGTGCLGLPVMDRPLAAEDGPALPVVVELIPREVSLKPAFVDPCAVGLALGDEFAAFVLLQSGSPVVASHRSARSIALFLERPPTTALEVRPVVARVNLHH